MQFYHFVHSIAFISTFMVLSLLAILMCLLQYNSPFIAFVSTFMAVRVIYCNVNSMNIECNFVVLFTLFLLFQLLWCCHYLPCEMCLLQYNSQ